MAISDKVIDLAPVNKTKNLILYIILGALAALSVVFIVLYAVKPNVTPIKVNSVNISATSLYDSGEGYTASYMCAYTVDAEVGVMGNADTTLKWECSPASAFYIFDDQSAENEELPTGSTTTPDAEGGTTTKRHFNFRAIGAPGTTGTIVAKSEGDNSVYAKIEFKIVEGVTGSVSLDGITYGKNSIAVRSEGSNIYSLSSALPHYSAQTTSSNVYRVNVSQFGLGGSAQISNSLIEGTTDYMNSLFAASSNDNIISVNTATPEFVDFTVNGVGEADLTVTANKHNSGEELNAVLKIKTVSSESLGVISSYYFLPQGVPEKEPSNYEGLRTSKTLTMYLGDNYVLEDFVIVKPWSRMTDWRNTYKISSDDNSIVREGAVGNKTALSAIKAGAAKVTIRDTSVNAAGATLEISVEVKIRVKGISVAGAASSVDNRYTVSAFRSQSDGKADLTYTFDATAGSNGTFDHTRTDCNLTVYKVVTEDGKDVEKLYSTASNSIVFKNFKGNVISVPNTNVAEKLPQIFASIGYSVQADASTGTHRYRFYSGAEASNGGKNWFEISFVVSIEPKGLAFTDYITPGADIAQFLKISRENGKTILTLNLGTPESASVSIADIIKFTDSEGSIAEDAYNIGIKRISAIYDSGSFSLGNSTAAYHTTKLRTITTCEPNDLNCITVRLYASENKTGQALATAKLYVRIVDNAKRVVPGNMNGSDFTIYNSLVEQSYKSDLTKAYNAQVIQLRTSDFVTFLETWSGKYTTTESYKINISLKSSANCLPKKNIGGTWYYFASEDAAEAGDISKGLFKLANGRLYVVQDFFILKSVFNSEEIYSEFTVYYSLGETAEGNTYVPDDFSGKVDYKLYREMQEINLYSDSTYTDTVEKDSNGYAVAKNQGDMLYLYVGGVYEYAESDGQSALTGKKIVFAYDKIAGDANTRHIKLTAYSSDIVTEKTSDTQFKLKTGVPSGGSIQGAIAYSVEGQSKGITINVTVQNKSAPVTSVKLYTDSSRTQEFSADGTVRTLDSSKVLKLYYEIRYQAGEGYISYETINFVHLNLDVDITDGASNIDSFTPEGTPDGSAHTETGAFEISASGGQNGSARWTLTPSSGKNALTYLFDITTYMPSSKAVKLSHGDTLFYSDTTNAGRIDLRLASGSDKPFVTLAAAFMSDSAYPVDVDNYSFTYDGKGLADAVYSRENQTVTLTSLGKTGSVTVALTFTEADTGKTYTVKIDLTVEADVYKLEITDKDGAVITTVALESLGINEDPFGYFEPGIRFNDGSADRDPGKTLSDVTFTIEGGSSIVFEAGKIKFANTLYALEGVYELKAVCGDVTVRVPVTLTTSACMLQFSSASADIFRTGTYSYPAGIFKANDLSTQIALPDGYALTYTVQTLSGGPTSLATVDQSGTLTVTGTAGTFKLVATLTSGGKTRASAEMQISINNLVAYINNKADFPNSVNGNGEIWLVKGGTLDFADYIELKSYDQGTPYAGADFTVAAPGLTVAGKKITASASGKFTVTLTANGDVTGKELKREIVVNVIEPTVSVSDAVLNAVEKTVLTLEASITDLGAAGNAGALTVAENGTSLFDVSVQGKDVTLELNTAGLDLSADRNITFTATYTLDGKAFTAAYTVTVKAENFVPQFDLYKKLSASEVVFTGNPDINDAYKLSAVADARVTQTKFYGKTDGAAFAEIVDPASFVFPSAGKYIVKLEAVVYGKTFSSAEYHYNVLNRQGLSLGVYSKKTGSGVSEADKIASVDAYYASGSPKSVFVVLDGSAANYAFAAGDFEISTVSSAVKATGSPTYDAASKKYIAEYLLIGKGDVTFAGKAVIDGAYYNASAASLDVTAPDASVTVTYTGGAVNPGTEVDLSAKVDVTNADSAVNTTRSVSYEILSGSALATLGGSLLKVNPCTAGGEITVRVIVKYTEGFFKNETEYGDIAITVKTIAAPTVSLAAEYATIKLAYGTASHTIGHLPVVAAGAGDSVGTPVFTFVSSDTSAATVDQGGTIRILKSGKKFTITATTVIGQGAWKGYRLASVYTVYAMPKAVFENGDLTPGETLNLQNKISVTGADGAFGFTAEYALVSGDAAKLVNGSLVGILGRSGSVTVKADITITSGDFAGFTAEGLSASVTVLGLGVKDTSGNDVSAFTVSSGDTEQISIFNGAADVSGSAVFTSADTSLVTVTNGLITVDPRANLEREGIVGSAKTVAVSVTFMNGGKTYKTQFTVTIPVTPKPAPVIEVRGDGTPVNPANGVYTVSVPNGAEIAIKLTADLTNNYAIGDYVSPYLEGADGGQFAVNVKQESSVFTLTMTALAETTGKKVKVLYTVKGNTFTAATLVVTVTPAVTVGDATLVNGAYADGASRQLQAGKTYTYTFTLSSGTFRYANFLYDPSKIRVSNFQFYQGNTQKTYAPWNSYNNANGEGKLFYARDSYSSYDNANKITVSVQGLAAGDPSFRIRVGSSYSTSSGTYFIPDSSATEAKDNLTVVADTFSESNLSFGSLESRLNGAVSVSPVLNGGFVADSIRYEKGTESVNYTVGSGGNVTASAAGTYTVRVTVRAAGTELTVNKDVTFRTAPTITSFYYDAAGGTPTLVVMQDGTAFSRYSVSYSASTDDFGTVDAATGAFTPVSKSYAGKVVITASLTVTDGLYSGNKLTATYTFTVPAAVEPILTATVANDKISVNTTDGFTVIGYTSDNPAVTVDASGNVFNTSLSAQNYSVTVVARFNGAGSPYDGKLYSVTTNAASIAAAGDEKAFTVTVDYGNGKFTADYDGRLTDVTVEYSLKSPADAAYLSIGANGAFTRTQDLLPHSVAVKAILKINGVEHKSCEFTVEIDAKEPTLTAAIGAGRVVVTADDGLAVLSYLSDNDAVTIDAAGNVTNTSLRAQTYTVTVIAKYTKAGSPYDGRLYYASVSGTIAADTESAFTAAYTAAGQGGTIGVSYDPRLNEQGTVTIDYISGNPDYVQVDGNGVVTVIKRDDTARDVTVTVKLSINGTVTARVATVSVRVEAAVPELTADKITLGGNDGDYIRTVALTGDFTLNGLRCADAGIVVRGDTIRNITDSAKAVTVTVYAKYTGTGDYNGREFSLDISVKLGVESEPVFNAQIVNGKLTATAGYALTTTLTDGLHIADDGTVTIVGSELTDETPAVVAVSGVYADPDSRFANRTGHKEISFQPSLFKLGTASNTITVKMNQQIAGQVFTVTSADESKLTISGTLETGYTLAWQPAALAGDKIVLSARLTYVLDNGVAGDFTDAMTIEKEPDYTVLLTNGVITLPADFTLLSLNADQGTAEYTDKLSMDVGAYTGLVTVTIKGTYHNAESEYNNAIFSDTVTVTIPEKTVVVAGGVITVSDATITDVAPDAGVSSLVTISESAGNWTYVWGAAATNSTSETLTATFTYELNGITVLAQKTVTVTYTAPVTP